MVAASGAPNFLWHLRIHPSVTDAIARRSQAEKLACLEIIRALQRNPRDRGLRVLPVKGINKPNVYVVPIIEPGDPERLYGLLTYQIYADHPAIHLFRIVFNDSSE